MNEHEALIAISVMAKEIEMLRYQNRQLEEANQNLVDQVEKLHIQVHIHKVGDE